MATNDSTMKFKADISELKAAMQQATRSIKLANAEFKAFAAGMTDWESSADGVGRKLTQLDSVLVSQKKKLTLMEQELEKTVKVYGENSAAADKVRIAIANQQAAINKTENEISKYTEKLEELKKAGDGIDDLPELEKQKQNVKAMEAELDALKQKYASLQLEERDTGKESEKLAKEIEDLSKELKASKTDIANAEKAADELDQSLEETGDSAEKASDGFTVMKGAIASLVADGVRFAIREFKELAKATFEAGSNFEAGMSQVAAISGANAAEIEQLTAKAKEMGASTKFSATQAAEAFNYMAMAGWNTEDMINGISGVMSLAAASGADLATTSDILTDALTAMGYSAGDAGKLADVMAAASSNANTNVELMGQTFQYAAPIVGALGYSMEDTAVAIGLMANAGIKGDKAGTALRSTLTRLSAPPKEAAEAMEALGISITDENGNMKELNEVIGDLRKAFDGLGETQQTQYAKALAGQNAMSGLLAIINAAPEDFDKLTAAVENSNGAAERMAVTMNDNVGGQITLLKSKIEGIMIKVFEKAAPRIRKAINNISDGLDQINWDNVADKAGDAIGKVVKLFDWLLKNGNSVGSTLKVIGTALLGIFVTNKVATFTSSVTTLVTTINTMKSATEGATLASKALGIAMNAIPLVAVAGGVAALGAAYYAWEQNAINAAKAEYELTTEQQNTIDSINDAKQAIEDLNAARNESMASINGEFGYIDKLKEEYNGLIDANGSVKEGYEDRAEFILTTLSEALGIEREEIQSLIDSNGKLSQSIDEIIEKQKAQAILTANEEAYTNAIANRDKTIQEYGESLRTLDEAETKYAESQKELAEAEATWEELINSNTEAAGAYAETMRDIKAANKEAEESYNSAKEAVDTAKQNYIDYNTTIQNYEGLQSAILSGESEKIQSALNDIQQSFITSQSGTKDILEKQVKDYEDKYYAMKAAVDNGLPGVTQAEVDGMANMVELAKEELRKLEPEASEAGKDAIISYGEGMTAESETVQNAAELIGKDTVGGIKEGATDSRLVGEETSKNYAIGVEKIKGDVKKAGERIGKESVSGQQSGASESRKTGESAASAYAAGISSQNTLVNKSGQQLGSTAVSGAATGSSGASSTGSSMGSDYVAGIGNQKGAAYSKGAELGAQAKSGAGSVSGVTSGENFGQGYADGITNKSSTVWNKAWNLAQNALAALRESQKEGSPSKLTYQSGAYFTQGYINGISSRQKALVKTVQNMVGTVINELGRMSNFNFNEVGANASDKFVSAMGKQANYMLARMQYENEKKVASFESEIKKLTSQKDSTITKLQNDSNKRVATLQTASDKKVASLQASSSSRLLALEKERDKKVADLQKKRDALTYSKKDSAERKKLQNQINTIKASYNTQINIEKAENKKLIASEQSNTKKLITAEKDNSKKEIAAKQKHYNQLIATQEKYQAAYEKASGEMINQFQDAINEYQRKAQALIDDTIGGITDKYNERYDELINKQNNLIDKLKNAGDLFEISGAGIMAVNDIKAQTKAINDYATKLKKVKTKVSAELFDQITSYDMTEGSAFIDRLLAMSAKDLNAYNKAYTEKMKAAQKAGEDIYKSDFNKIAKDYKNEINTAFKSIPQQLQALGNEAMKGFVDGLTKNTDYMDTNVKIFVKSMVDQFRKELKIKSPSKVMFSIGDYSGEGLNDGLMSWIKKVQATASNLAGSVASPLNAAITDINGIRSTVATANNGYANQGKGVVNNYYDLVQNNTSPKALSALETYQARRRQLSMLKVVTMNN